MDEKEYHKFVKEFIYLYKSFPCLWRVKSRDYHMRELRANAYKVLAKKLKEIDNSADRGAVVRKINSLRSNLRKEKRKVQEMAKIGISYQPRLWYYPCFSFLDGQERDGTKGDHESEEDSTDAVNIKVELSTELMETEIEYEEEKDDPLQSFEKPQDRDSNASPTPSKEANCVARPDFVQASSSKITPDPISKTHSEKFDTSTSLQIREDQYNVFGKNVAVKLRDIALKDNTQRLMAEKIINDALFLAQMGHLTLSHCNKLNSE